MAKAVSVRSSFRVRLTLSAFFFLSPLFLLPHSALALTCNDQANGNWDSTATWDCGVVPDANDDVVIDSHTVTITSDSLSNSVGISGGTLNMGSYTHTTSGSWTYSSGSLNAQTSTLRFAFVSPAQTFTPGTADYYNFEWAGTGNGDLTISGTLVVANNLTLSATYVYSDLLSGTIEAKGDIDITSADYNGDQTTAVILINGTGDQTISSSGGGSFGPININKPSGTLIMLGTIGAANDWTHTAGTVDAGTSTLSLRSTSNSDTFTPGSMEYYNLEWAGAGNADLTVSGTATVTNNFVVDAVFYNADMLSGTIEVQGDLDITHPNADGIYNSTLLKLVGTSDQTISNTAGGKYGPIEIDKPSGTVHLNGTIISQGDWTHTSGNLDAGTSTLKFMPASDSCTFTPGSVDYYNLDWAGTSSGNLTISGTANVTNDFIVSASFYNANLVSGTIEVHGDTDITHVEADGTGCTTLIKLVGTGDQTVSNTAGGMYTSFEIDKPLGTVNLVGTIITQGDWVVTNGAINAGTSTLRLESSDHIAFTPGSDSYYNLEWAGLGNTDATVTGTAYVANNFTIDANSFNADMFLGSIEVQGDVAITNTNYTASYTTTILKLTGTSDQTISDAVTSDFGPIEINKPSGSAVLGTAIIADDDLTITSGILELAGYQLTVNGNFNVNSGGTLGLLGTETFTVPTLNDGSSILYNNTSDITLPTIFTTYQNLVIDEAGSSDPVFTLPDTNIIVEGTLSVIDGTLAFDDNRDLTVNDTQATGTAITVSASGVLTNTGTGDLYLGGGVQNSGSISFDSAGTPADDDIFIGSTSFGVPRSWQGSGTFALVDLEVQDQTAIGGSPAQIVAASSIDSGNNTNWLFNAPPVASAISPPAFDEDTESVITLSYTDVEGDNATTCTISLLANVTVSTPCSCAAGTCTIGVTGSTNYNGAASFSYTVMANGAQSNSATASLTIAAVTDFYSISGAITDGSAPLSGVSVVLTGVHSATASTNASGSYSIGSIPENTSYTLTPSFLGYTFSPQSGTLVGDIVHDFTGTAVPDPDDHEDDGDDDGEDDEPGGSTIRGTVTIDGDPVAEARVVLGTTDSQASVSQPEKVARWTLSDNGGQYEFTNVPIGTYKLSAEKQGTIISQTEVVSDTETEVVETELPTFKTTSLGSTLYSLWNSYLGMLNILELTNKGDEPFRATIQLYDSKSEGSSAVALVPALTFTLPVGEKIDLPLSSIGPVTEDSIGFLEITANHGKIEGGMSVYRSNQYNPERFDFAFHSPLRTSSLGNGYTLANTFQPARTNSEPVYNWLSLANPTNTAASFTLNYYWDSGELALQRALRIPPKGRHDIDGGHSTLGANRAGMIEILPDDSTSPYIAALSRYSMVEETDEYAFAFSKSAGAAYSAAQFLAITNLEQNRSFLEIGNVLHQVSTATLSWFDSSGTLVSQNSVDLGAKSITHIQLNNHLPSGAAGSLKIEAEPAGALYLQAVSYQFNEDFGEVLEAQAAPPLSGLASELSASYNLYLGMANWARLINFSNAPIAVELIYGSDSQSLEIALGVNARRDIGLHELGLSTDTYGPITLKSSKAGALGGEVVRSRKDSSGQFELLTTIPLR